MPTGANEQAEAIVITSLADEEQRLANMADNLGIKVTHDANTQQLIERFKLSARIDAGDLPVITSAILLQRGEICHAEYSCRLHELRTVTKRINYSGPSGRIRIMKGLSWRYGSVSVQRVTQEEMRQLDSGVLYITNKRLLFNGAAKNANTPFKKVIHFTLYKDGLQIEKETGRDQFYLGAGDLEVLVAFWRRHFERLNRQDDRWPVRRRPVPTSANDSPRVAIGNCPLRLAAIATPRSGGKMARGLSVDRTSFLQRRRPVEDDRDRWGRRVVRARVYKKAFTVSGDGVVRSQSVTRQRRMYVE